MEYTALLYTGIHLTNTCTLKYTEQYNKEIMTQFITQNLLLFDLGTPGTICTTVTNEGIYTGMDSMFVKVNLGKYEIIQSANSPTERII